MRRAWYAWRPRLDVLESRLQPGSLLDATWNGSLLAEHLSLMGPLLEDVAETTRPNRFQRAEEVTHSIRESDFKPLPPDAELPGALNRSPLAVPSAEALEPPLNVPVLPLPPGPEVTSEGNCLLNGDFETGDLSSWGVGNPKDEDVGVDDIAPHSGAFGAYFGSVGMINTLSQTCETAAPFYTISFWMQNRQGGQESVIMAYWGEEFLLYLANEKPFGYVQFTFENVPTPTTETTLTFLEQHDLDFWDLDDVVVRPS